MLGLDWSAKVSSQHYELLKWFETHAGELVPYSALDNPNFKLVHRPKGIWKPANWDYALSVRETLSSTYTDVPISNKSNGDWDYLYHEETGGAARNNGLIRCMEDGVPVGVLIQQTGKPYVTYWVVGLGRITQFDGNWFSIEQWESASIGDPAIADTEMARYETLQNEFDPADVEQDRDVRLQAMRVRHGQGLFRSQLLKAYKKRCAFTNYSAVEALDAAHIIPYDGRVTNHPTNGLLLRADIHKLFDIGLVAVDTSSWTQIVSPQLSSSEYATYHRKALLLPDHLTMMPSVKALNLHREKSGL